ncbi:MAG: ROK family protein [Nanoarchaeota archaeon]|jgi:glucokinase|nr:ROK family protein [Nanoarchaeota archaeon]
MKKQVIAFDIGGTNTRCALVEKNKIIKFDSIKTPKTRKKFLDNVCSMTEAFMSPNVKGIGIAFPSTIEKGIVKHPTNVPLKNFDLARYIEGKFKKKCKILNDASCVALAEAHLGCKKKDFFVLTLGTGIGGGIIVDGKIYQGIGRGSEFGHMYVRGADFESLWKATKKKIIRYYGEGVLVKDLVKIKEKKCKDILLEAADYLGEGIASIVTILDPETVILAGGIKESGPVFLKMIQDSVKKYAFIQRKIPVSWSKLSEPGILGASLLID